MRKLLTRTGAIIAAAVAVVAINPAGALAAPASHPTTAGSADFSVSSPAEPLEAGTGKVVHTQITVANNGVHDLTVALKSVGVKAGNNGAATMSDTADPTWSKNITVTPSLTLAAHTYQTVPVTIRVPSGLLPDLYLLGFVAEAQPVDKSAAVRVYHRIGTLVTVELPGARERHLAITLGSTGFIHLGSKYSSGFVVTNVGAASALGRGQVQIQKTFGKTPVAMVQTTGEMELFASGTSRYMPFKYAVHGLLLYARPEAMVLYGNSTDTLQAAVVEGRPVLIVPWLTLILLGVTAVVLTAYLVWSRRRRAAARRELMARRRHTRTSTGRHRAAGAAWAR